MEIEQTDGVVKSNAAVFESGQGAATDRSEIVRQPGWIKIAIFLPETAVERRQIEMGEVGELFLGGGAFFF